MSEEFKVEIVNPEKSFLSKENVTEVVVPAFEGEMGILKDHISIISFLKPGIITIYSKSGEEKFFAEDGILLMNIEPSDDTSSKVIGEIQYLHNAYVTIGSEYMPDMTGKTIKSKTPLQLIGPILNKDGIYTFDIDLRTLDDSSNAVYTLSDYHYEINFKKST